MKVSVLTITYNQEKSITAAVESALMQATDFDIEIIVADDCSTDGTREIVLDLARRHPDKVRAICRDKNLGSNVNLLTSLAACSGEYVALLEGDDRWTDPRKLQRQADFLDAHADYSLCCHAVNVVHEDGSRPPYRFPDKCPATMNLDEMLRGVGCSTCSYMFRRRLLLSLPDWLWTLWIGDWPIRMLLAEQGYIGYIDEVMAEYRVHSSGVWSGTSQAKQLEGALQTYRCVRRHLGSRCSKQTAWLVACRACRLSRERERAGNREEARLLLIEAVGVLLEETPDDKNLLDELVKAVDRIANHTIATDSPEATSLGTEGRRRHGGLIAASRESARIKASRFWRIRQFLLSTPILGRLLRAMRRR
jgi:glycosyltransferase involved in cell wall biosynthesis